MLQDHSFDDLRYERATIFVHGLKPLLPVCIHGQDGIAPLYPVVLLDGIPILRHPDIGRG